MAKIILLSIGSGGDVFPVIQIGKELVARGHQAVIFTRDMHKATAEAAGLAFVSICQSRSYETWLERRHLPDGKAARQTFALLDLLCMFDIVSAHCHSVNTILVGISAQHLLTQMLAEKFNIPYLPVFPSPYFVETMARTLRICVSHSRQIDLIRREIGLPPVSDWESWLSVTQYGIGLWPQWFGGSDPGWNHRIRPVGFIQNDIEMGILPYDLQAFIGDHKPAVLITHGSSHTDRDNFFTVAVEATRRLRRKGVLVAQEIDSISGLRDDDIRCYKQLPFAALMPRVEAVIHHGGIGTSGQAMASGIPQLILPYNYDRLDNATRLKRLGVADYVLPDQWRPEVVANSLHNLLTSSVVPRICKEQSAMGKDRSSVLLACEIIESLVSKDTQDSGWQIISGINNAEKNTAPEFITLQPVRKEGDRWISSSS